MRVFIFCFWISLVLNQGLGQTVERQAFGLSGGIHQQGSWEVSQTTGEALTQSVIAGHITISQGFQQGEATEQPTEERPQPPISVTYGIYPNPTVAELYLRFKGEEPITVIAALYDQAGRGLPDFRERIAIDGYTERIWDLSPLAAGVYVLRMIQLDGKLLEALRISKQ
jgi:hypothetical protein